MARSLICTLVLALLVAFATPAAAGLIYVPGNHATIGAALSAALAGDTILVAPGVYKENLTWPSRDGIQLIAVAGPAQTILDGQQQGRVVVFGTGLTRATLLEGFTITGGLMNTTRNHGAGLYIQSSVTLRGNVITANVSDGTSWNYGGGIHITSGASPLIERNVISKNVCRNGSWNYGAGIYIDGGAVPSIVNNEIIDNQNTAGSRGYGGGIFVDGVPAPEIVGNVIARNTCLSTTSLNYGGGIRVYNNAAANIVNNTIVGNTAARGAGIEYAGTTAGRILMNIIADNVGSGLDAATAVPSDFNNLWNNSGGNYSGSAKAGPNSFSLDPLFAGTGDYHLTFRSPCVDAGHVPMLSPVTGQDYDGDPRRLDGDLDGLKGNGAMPDVGADEFSNVRLAVTGVPRVGTTITFHINGPGGSAWSLLYSPARGNVFVQPYGTALLGVPFAVLVSGATPGKPVFPIPAAAVLIGVRVHVQGIVGLVSGGQPVGNLTNRVDLLFY